MPGALLCALLCAAALPRASALSVPAAGLRAPGGAKDVAWGDMDQMAVDIQDLCAAVVPAVGCGATLAAPARLVRDVCPSYCSSQGDRRRLAQKNCSVDLANRKVDLSCIDSSNEKFRGEGEIKQTCVDECMAAEEPMPIAFALLTTFVLVCCSAFCSGLTLGLMGLDMTMLTVLLQSGTEQDKKNAAKIAPLRSTGNRLLCVLLITNTAVNAGLAIVMAGFTGGFSGFILSTLLIMIFGEITPQAICSRHGLAIGAFLYPVIWLVCMVFFPLAYPIAQVLDMVLGSEVGLSYSREELIALLAMHSVGGRTEQGPQGDIHDTEAKILQGVLKFSGKTADSVYTPIKLVDTLGVHEKLSLPVMNAIYRSGHSRIPIYEGKKDNMVGIIFIKDLILIDPEDEVAVKKVVDYFHHPMLRVSKEIGLLTLLDEFMEGHSHMCVVVDCPLEVLDPGETVELYDNPADESAETAADDASSSATFDVDDEQQTVRPTGEVDLQGQLKPTPTGNMSASLAGQQIGIVTLEDLFEEMLTLQIHDEHDVYLLEHKEVEGHDEAVEKIVNQRSKAHIHEVPPRWLSHFGRTHAELSDEAYTKLFTDATLETLAERAGADDVYDGSTK